MKRYHAEPVLADLKDFQRATVDHVTDRYFGEQPTRRFLVADETGLGKSLVARGVIARLVEKLQDDDRVKRIDVIYICANQDIAEQNLARLQITANESIALSSRLTLLAKHSSRLRRATARAGKPLNLVAFTPGTSFDKGWRTGKVEERALLFLLLERARSWDGWARRAALRALQGTVQDAARFEGRVERLRAELADGIDKQITREFLGDARQRGLIRKFDRLIGDIGRRNALPPDLRERAFEVVGELRTCLARAGVQTLEPDLVILDEFQRFRHLLDRDEGGEAAELAHDLFEYEQAKVLLLSATPYKPFTYAEEAEAGNDHHRDFRRTLSFLCDDSGWNAQVTAAFDTYREAVVHGHEISRPRQLLRQLLLSVMTRTERPAAAQTSLLRETQLPADDVEVAEVLGYAALRSVARHLEAPATVEYWKSAPYFLNFTEGYQLGEKLRSVLKRGRSDDLDELLSVAQLLDAKALRRYEQVDLGNGRLRRLATDTVDRGWWKLLWLPPSLPHYRLSEPFRTASAEGMTKRLLFSSWAATPTAVAGLLSYGAERKIVAGRLRRNDPSERRRVATRLDYRLEDGTPGAMSTLALFWPHPVLAEICDPLAPAQRRPDRIPELGEVETELRAQLISSAPDDLYAGETSAWAAFFRWPGGGLPDGLTVNDAVAALGGRADEEAATEPTRLTRHVELALETAELAAPATTLPPERVTDDLVAIGTHGAGNIAWRALGRLLTTRDEVTPAGHWRAAAIVSSGLRSLFNRIESTLLLDQLLPDAGAYWQAVLRYTAAGGLQAVLDEYVHHLRSTVRGGPLNDDLLRRIAEYIADALSLRPSVYRAFDPAEPDKPISLLSRFALRYGRQRDDTDGARQPEVRNAFNSPFWPFIVATTSAGQEGIDFHWWCSAVVHWNIPASPVDFEQREGRVHRFGGHAIRRNVAAKHRAEALRAGGSDVWKAAYDAAREESGGLGDFAPYWVYEGPAKIERYILPYPLSRDIGKLERLKEDLALYRLAFGQPRQEDMLALLRRNGVTAEDAATATLVLTPPGLFSDNGR
jgi:hypothetical protein